MPTIIAERGGTSANKTAPAPATNFTNRIVTSSPATGSGCSTNTRQSMRMPIDTKKRLLKLSRNGNTSAIA